MQELTWTLKNEILVTCADCIFLDGCDDVKEDYAACGGFQDRSSTK